MADLILIVEDEIDIAETVRYNLDQAGFEVMAAGDAETALSMLSDSVPSLIVLDLMLPGMDGIDLCKIIKEKKATRDIPICVLSARKNEIDRVLAFELGVDDYVEKPFSPRELVLRVRSILKRVQLAQAQVDERLDYGILVVDKSAYKVFVEGQVCALTPIEFQLLVTLMDREGRVQTREALLRVVWGDGHVGSGRMVDAHIRRMRGKLGEAQHLIRTVRGVGYCFRT